MKKGKMLGRGMTAEVYEWEEDKVLKLYYEKFSDNWINFEAKTGYAVHETGVPSPAVFDIISLEGRKGIVLQRIYGRTILKQLETEPWKLNYYTREMAGFHFRIHQLTSDKLPSQKEKFEALLRHASDKLGRNGARVSNYFKKLPDGSSLCHGDLHFSNIIDSSAGLVALDWKGAYRGNPLGDVARTCLMICSPLIPMGNIPIANLPYMSAKWLTYLVYASEYLRLAKVSLEDIAVWLPVVAAARLNDRIPGEEKWLLGIIDKYLQYYG